MNVLVIAPHPDDETIGCGGTVCKHSAHGDRVATVFLTSGELGLKRMSREHAWRIRETEAKCAASILGIARLEFLRLPDWAVSEHVREAAKGLRSMLEDEQPKVIYLPHPKDGHPDHQAALPILKAALRNSRFPPPELRGYEIWTPLPEYQRVEDITAVIHHKLRALHAHRSQLDSFDYDKAMLGLNQFRGELAAKCRYAEVFQVLPPNVSPKVPRSRGAGRFKTKLEADRHPKDPGIHSRQ